MNPIESSLKTFLEDIRPILKLTRIKTVKRIHRKYRAADGRPSGSEGPRNITNKEDSLHKSLQRAWPEIAKRATFRALEDALLHDPLNRFRRAHDGNHLPFQYVVQKMLSASMQIRGNAIKVDQRVAYQALLAIGRLHSGKEIEFTVAVELSGVKLRSKSLPLPDDTILYRNTQAEQNQRKDFEFRRNPHFGPFFKGYETEIRGAIMVPLDHSRKDYEQRPTNDATRMVNNKFRGIVYALLLGFPGRAGAGACEIQARYRETTSNRFDMAISGKSSLPIVWMSLGKRDIPRLHKAYDIVFGDSSVDRVLYRALNRFILGRTRSDEVDKLVDYVIAWESILLTLRAKEAKEELSYRFRLNGALLLSFSQRNRDRYALLSKMRHAYAMRSTIVHGGTDESIERDLKKSGFGSLAGVCNFLEQGFRDVVFWLTTIEPMARPYIAENGWERLHWA